MKYPLGTKYVKCGRRQSTCTVIDYATTRNLVGEVIHARYVVSYSYEVDYGRTTVSVTEHDVREEEINNALALRPLTK